MRAVTKHRGALVLLASVAAACASGPRGAVLRAAEQGAWERALAAYERLRADEGADAGLLGRVASRLLEYACLSGEPRHRAAAFAELRLAGTAAVPALERLARTVTPTVVRARALAVLLDRGRASAADGLRALLGDGDPEVVAAAVGALDPGREASALVALLGDAHAEVRGASALALRGAAPSVEARAALMDVARRDPEASVRGAATTALGAFGRDVGDALRERLSDPHLQVRQAAARALVRIDPAAAAALLGALLEAPTGPEGIEAARWLAEEGPSSTDRALGRAYLRRALVSPARVNRLLAGTALAALCTDAGISAELTALVEADPDASTRGAVAAALVRGPCLRGEARRALEALVASDDPSVAVHAAAALAPERHPGAVARLGALLDEGDPLVRQAAANALAREALEPDLARSALIDRDPVVRIHAAGAMLAATNRL